MKKPVLILTSLVAVSASAFAFFVPGGHQGNDSGQRVLNTAGKQGVISPAQAEAVKRAQVAAAGRANEANSAMASDSNKQPGLKAPAPQPPAAQSPAPQAQPVPNGPANGQPVAQEERRLPRFRLEGVMVGGKAKPSAIFVVEGWGEAVLHVGEKLNEDAKVVKITSVGVALISKDHKLQVLTPW